MPTEAQVRSNFSYYGFAGEELEDITQSYMERVEDGDAPDQAQYADDWRAAMDAL